jgi:hypothetical protein
MEKMGEKYKKYGLVRRKSNETEKSPSEEEVKRRQRMVKERKRREEVRKEMIHRWKTVKSHPFTSNTQNMFKWMLRPVNGVELVLDDKKQIRTHFNQGFIDLLNKKWRYNMKMGDCMWKCKFDKECINNTLTQLSVTMTSMI